METGFTVPPELRESYYRLLPYMVAAVRGNVQSQEAILLYLKFGGEKLARVVIDAFNQTHRLEAAKMQKLRLEEAMLNDQIDEESEEDEEEDDEEASALNEKTDGDDDVPEY
ncbi:MAG: hypothetical protein M0036_26825 [Desulfobacteraceae bacterium]|nr:hypothetical protein [Desulfobacteraceae bacterium]